MERSPEELAAHKKRAEELVFYGRDIAAFGAP
jgi:hypothetical protein